MQPIPSANGKHIYYVKLSQPGIWRVPVDGGDEEQIIDQGDWNRWDAFAEGLCFVSVRALPHAAIECLRFETGRVETILPLDKPVPNGGFSVSRDGAWILYTQVDTSDSDLMLVQGFR